MKLGAVTELYKRNTETARKIDYDVLSTNCDVIVFFLIFGQFTAILKLDSGGGIYKTYYKLSINIFINNNRLSYKT